MGMLANSSSDQRPRRGTLFHLLWPVTSYVVTNVTVTLFWLFFFVFNRTVVIGRRNVGEESNTLLLSNHQSMLDSFVVGLAAFYPRSWLKPRLLPCGRYVPRIFKRIAVSFGAPVDYTDLLAMPRTRETAQAVIDRVMAAIRVQHAELRRQRTRDVPAVDEARGGAHPG